MVPPDDGALHSRERTGRFIEVTMKPACTAFLPAYAVVAYVALRMSLAKWSPIGDCDEVYNYWEPVHFLHHGT